MSDENVFSTPEYDALLNHVEEAKREVREKARGAVAALFKAFFAANPVITAVRWRQYTPYFNDGEPCEFSVHDAYACTKVGVGWPKTDGDEEPEDEDDDLFLDSYDLEDGAAKEALRSIKRSFNDDVFLAAFGDHAQVTATPDGFHVTEYSHN